MTAKNDADVRIVNVRDFGAIGDGKADDTAAIEKAWAFVMNTRKPQFQEKWTISINTVLYFPQGIYRYAGQGLQAGPNDAQTWEIKGDGFNSARIDIENEVYFITCGRVQSTVIRDLSFNGGKGVFRSTHTGNMVGGKHIFKNCYFFNYSECAIGNNADDSPYLLVSDSIFHCRKGADAIGIAWGGYVDDSQITRCSFERNAYHIKVGDRLSGSFQIGPRNLFLSFGGTKTKADIWIVPNAEGNMGINSGQGSLINDNKFGNENINHEAPRVLIAAEDTTSGANRLTRTPSDTIEDARHAVTGWRFRGNLIMGSQVMRRGFVYSRIPHTALILEPNYFVGGPYPWLIEFDTRIERLPDRTPGNNAHIYPQERDNAERDLFPTDLCNLPGYAITLDPHSNFAGTPEAPAIWSQPQDPAYFPFIALTGKDMPVSGAATTTPTKDARGELTAANIKLENNISGLEIRIDQEHTLTEGRVAFLDIELKAAPKNSLEHVSVMVLNKNASTDASGPAFLGDKQLASQRVFSRAVKLQPHWQRVTLPFVVRDTRAARFHLAIRPYGYNPQEFLKNEKEAFECGNVRIYHATSPDAGERKGVRTVTDQDITLRAGIDPEQIIFTGHLTSKRTVTFSLNSASIRPLGGARFRISRPAQGNIPLEIGALTTLSADEWCDVIFAQGAFHISAKGKL